MMSRRFIYVFALLALLSSCALTEEDPTIAIPERQDSGTCIDAPGVRIIDVKTDGFTANWHKVSDALEYEYIFDEQEAVVTRDTNLVFTGLAVDTEHILKMRALPREETGRLASKQVVVNVTTSQILPLDMPNLAIGSSFSSIAIISWDVVKDAVSYEWTLGELKDTTTKTFVTFEGLVEGQEYTLAVRALSPDQAQNTDSDASTLSFIPVNDGSAKVKISNLSCTSDAVQFNIFASQAQYYWYEMIPKVKALGYDSEEAWLESVKASLDESAAALQTGGKSVSDSYAEVLKSGSTTVQLPACSSLSYSIIVFAMDLAGNVSDMSVSDVTTPADLDSDGPSYASEGDWFSQSAMLGSTASTASTYIYFKRKGTGVASVQYALFTTSKFVKTYGEEVTDDVANQLVEYLTANGTAATAEALEKINSDSGYTAGYSKREPGTSYTLAALATNEAGEQILCVNSVKTRLTTAENNWISYALNTRSTSEFVLKVSIADGLDAVSGKFYYAVNADITAQYSRADYRSLVLENGTELSSDQISELNANGYTYVTVSGLESATSYFVGTAITDSVGDTTVKTSSVSTK